jgi:hypothetical protein
MKYEIRAMLRQGKGSIANISFSYGKVGGPTAAVYVGSKHAVEGTTKSAAIELAGTGVRVNIVGPGPTETRMLNTFAQTQENKANFLESHIPTKRMGTPEEIANTAAHWHTTTMICSIRLDGSTACMTIEGATDAEVFRAYVRRVLCPTLRKGDVVIMDNLSPHKSELTLSLIEQAGAEVLFLPAYSPDLNPIEKMWSLRSAQARTQPAPLALASVTRQDAMNWFASCGYSFI